MWRELLKEQEEGGEIKVSRGPRRIVLQRLNSKTLSATQSFKYKHEGEHEKNKPECQSLMLYFRSPARLSQEESISFRLGSSFT